MSEKFSLNCFILGSPSNEVYEVKISKNKTAIALRKQIAEEPFQRADPDALQLFRVSIHKADVETKLGNVLDPANAPGATELLSRSRIKLATLFPSPGKEDIHVIVARPSAGQGSRKARGIDAETDTMASSGSGVHEEEASSFQDPQYPGSTLRLVPSNPFAVPLCHPANDLRILSLPAYDLISQSPLRFGIHHETLATAGRIVAYNKSGYLSTSKDRNARRVDADLDSILPVGKYYYHLDMPGADPLYPICRDFSLWDFPHNRLPQSWAAPSPTSLFPWEHDLEIQSEAAKARDGRCRISKWEDSMTAAHIVPQAKETWLDRNNMVAYLDGHSPMGNSSRNIFALRYDLHLGQFDQGNFVILPKSGQLRVHFVSAASKESAQLYHNSVFDHESTLAHELLYARFAWAILKLVIDGPEFNYSNGDVARAAGVAEGRGGGGSGKKRKRGDDNIGRDKDSGKQVQDHDLDARELEEDLKKAALTHTFFVDPTQPVSAFRYEDTVWYPGHAAVERRKQAYFNEHPQIRAHSDRILPDTYGSEEEPV